MTRYFLVFILSIWTLFGCGSGEIINSDSAEGKFKIAEKLENDEHFEEALNQYALVKNKHPYSQLAILSELKIADIHYKKESYLEAQNAYQLFKDFHPTHSQSAYVTFRLALCYFNQLPSTIDRDLILADKAIHYFDETILTYSSSEYVKEAKEKKELVLKMLAEKELYIADFYFDRAQFTSALNRYESVLKLYPKIGFDSKALYRATISASKIGDREKSQIYLKQLTSEFPQSSDAEKAKSELGQ